MPNRFKDTDIHGTLRVVESDASGTGGYPAILEVYGDTDITGQLTVGGDTYHSSHDILGVRNIGIGGDVVSNGSGSNCQFITGTFDHLNVRTGMICGWYTNGTFSSGHFTSNYEFRPILCSIYRLPVLASDTLFIANPGYILQLFAVEGYAGGGFTINAATSDNPVAVLSSDGLGVDDAVSVRVFYKTTADEITIDYLS